MKFDVNKKETDMFDVNITGVERGESIFIIGLYFSEVQEFYWH